MVVQGIMILWGSISVGNLNKVILMIAVRLRISALITINLRYPHDIRSCYSR